MDVNDSSLEENKEDFSELVLLEAALYVAGRPLDLGTLGSTMGIRSKESVLKLAKDLMARYKSYDSPLEILELKDHRFVLQLKARYAPRVSRLSQRPTLTIGPLRTLSYIAYNQPVLQTKVILTRGKHSYTHLKTLERLKLITRTRAVKRTVIWTTPFFADCFGLSHDLPAMKRQLKMLFNKEKHENQT